MHMCVEGVCVDVGVVSKCLCVCGVGILGAVFVYVCMCKYE